MRVLVAFFLGILFSIGLTISGMVNPNKVIGFLDIFRQWDPDLIFVMGGAVSINLVLFRLILKRNKPIMAANFQLPGLKLIDRNLVLGASLFGIGWGIGGICPGPGLANLFTLKLEPLVFVLFMLVGMYCFKLMNRS